MNRVDELMLRQSTLCPGCGSDEPANLDCLVCWDCFKYRQDVVPFKYWERYTPLAGDLEAWLKANGRPSLEEQGLAALP